MVNNLPANSGNTGSIPGRGRLHMSSGNEPVCHQLLKRMHPTADTPQQEKPLQRCPCSAMKSLLSTTRESPIHSSEDLAGKNGFHFLRKNYQLNNA